MYCMNYVKLNKFLIYNGLYYVFDMRCKKINIFILENIRINVSITFPIKEMYATLI